MYILVPSNCLGVPSKNGSHHPIPWVFPINYRGFHRFSLNFTMFSLNVPFFPMFSIGFHRFPLNFPMFSIGFHRFSVNFSHVFSVWIHDIPDLHGFETLGQLLDHSLGAAEFCVPLGKLSASGGKKEKRNNIIDIYIYIYTYIIDIYIYI